MGAEISLQCLLQPTLHTQLHTCDIREDRKCTQYLTIQLNTTWFFNYPKVGNNLSVPRAMLQLIKQSVVDVVKTSGVSHVWIFTHMSTVHFLLRQKRVYTTSSIFDVQPAHFQLLCLHLVPMLIIMRGLKVTFKWYFPFWQYCVKVMRSKVQCFLLFGVKGGWGVSDRANCYQILRQQSRENQHMRTTGLSSNYPTNNALPLEKRRLPNAVWLCHSLF